MVELSLSVAMSFLPLTFILYGVIRIIATSVSIADSVFPLALVIDSVYLEIIYYTLSIGANVFFPSSDIWVSKIE